MVHVFNLVAIVLILISIKEINLVVKNNKHQKMVSAMIADLKYRIDNDYISINDAQKEIDFLEMLIDMKLK